MDNIARTLVAFEGGSWWFIPVRESGCKEWAYAVKISELTEEGLGELDHFDDNDLLNIGLEGVRLRSRLREELIARGSAYGLNEWVNRFGEDKYIESQYRS